MRLEGDRPSSLARRAAPETPERHELKPRPAARDPSPALRGLEVRGAGFAVPARGLGTFPHPAL